MDVHCSTCKEPWDVYHLRHEAIFDTDLPQEEAEGWQLIPSRWKLCEHYREKFKAAGWEFGKTIINVIHCPCCPKSAKADPYLLETKAILENFLWDDEDGLASSYEEHHL